MATWGDSRLAYKVVVWRTAVSEVRTQVRRCPSSQKTVMANVGVGGRTDEKLRLWYSGGHVETLCWWAIRNMNKGEIRDNSYISCLSNWVSSKVIPKWGRREPKTRLCEHAKSKTPIGSSGASLHTCPLAWGDSGHLRGRSRSGEITHVQYSKYCWPTINTE